MRHHFLFTAISDEAAIELANQIYLNKEKKRPFKYNIPAYFITKYNYTAKVRELWVSHIINFRRASDSELLDIILKYDTPIK